MDWPSCSCQTCLIPAAESHADVGPLVLPGAVREQGELMIRLCLWLVAVAQKKINLFVVLFQWEGWRLWLSTGFPLVVAPDQSTTTWTRGLWQLTAPPNTQADKCRSLVEWCSEVGILSLTMDWKTTSVFFRHQGASKRNLGIWPWGAPVTQFGNGAGTMCAIPVYMPRPGPRPGKARGEVQFYWKHCRFTCWEISHDERSILVEICVLNLKWA